MGYKLLARREYLAWWPGSGLVRIYGRETATKEPRMSDIPPVILIGIDAAEINVLDRLVAEGRLPNLAKLRGQGRRGRLQTEQR